MPLIYNTGNLFSDKTSLLAHACNCKGQWGPIIAAQFKRLFIEAYLKYKNHCSEFGVEGTIGCFAIFDRVVCLFTSRGFSKEKDSEEEILKNTYTSVNTLLNFLNEINPDKTIAVASPKINAGMFGVPWEKTEKILLDATEKYERTWIVYTNEDKKNG